MKGLKSRIALGMCVVVILLTSALLVSGFAKSKVEQKGDVVMATWAPIFYQVGGDPATHSSGYPFVAQTIFDSLIYADKDQNMTPSIAKSWKISQGWRVYDFFLRDDIKFHNGETLTVEDVKYSLEQHLRKEFKYVFYWLWSRKIKSIEIVGPNHLRITLNSPSPGFIGRLWWGTGIFPKKYREKVGDKTFADKPIGTGPYRWLDYKQDVYWKAEAVEHHFRHTPEIKTFKVVYTPEHSTRLAMLKAGEADIIFATGPQLPQIKADPKLRIIWGKWPILRNLVYCDMVAPKEPSPFHDIRVREAVSLAIDRKTMCEKLFFGASEPYGEVLAPITWGFDPTVKPDPFDPERAKKLLAEAGYANGFKTTLHSLVRYRYWMEAIASSLDDIGIKSDIKVYEGGAYQELSLAKKLRGLTHGTFWWHSEKHASADLSDFIMTWSRGQYATTPEIHQAVLDGMTVVSEEGMIAVGRKLSKMIRDARVRAILWAENSPYGVNKRIVGWAPQLGAMPGTAYEYIRIKK
jgi:peptide/nickel transport system substrate-binding protein